MGLLTCHLTKRRMGLASGRLPWGGLAALLHLLLLLLLFLLLMLLLTLLPLHLPQCHCRHYCWGAACGSQQWHWSTSRHTAPRCPSGPAEW